MDPRNLNRFSEIRKNLANLQRIAVTLVRVNYTYIRVAERNVRLVISGALVYLVKAECKIFLYSLG
jgi:hypothetical protein